MFGYLCILIDHNLLTISVHIYILEPKHRTEKSTLPIPALEVYLL